MRKIPAFLFYSAALLSIVAPLSAEVDLSLYGGPTRALLQDIKVRYFDLPGRQVWWEEHHVGSPLDAGVGASMSYISKKNIGVQGDFFYNHSAVSADMEGTQFGKFTMQQQRYDLMLSFLGRTRVHRLGLSSIYGSCGLGAVYTDYSYIPDGWVLGGQFSLGADIASTGRSNFFLELKYIWHEDVGQHRQSPGQHLKTSGNPSWNMATHLMGPHYDTEIIGLMMGIKFKLSKAQAP